MPGDESTATIPEVRPWRSRLLAAPALPGSVDDWLHDLRVSLDRLLGARVGIDTPTRWSSQEPQQVTGEWLLRRLGPIGLVQKSHFGLIEVTDEARTWLECSDDRYLIGLLHSRIRFVGEALAAIRDGARTHEKLLHVAVTQYGLGWSSLDQVRRRTNWLRAANFLEKWSHTEIRPSASGLALLNILQNADPSTLPHIMQDNDRHVAVPEGGAQVAELLTSVDNERLATRKRVIGFIPAGRDGESLFESLRRLVTFCSPKIDRDEFRRVCASELGLSKSSAETALATLRSSGLIQHAGINLFEPTPWAQEWLENSEPLDLVRILHAHVLAFGELIKMLSEPTEVGALIASAQRVFGDDSPQRSEITMRLRILTACGLLNRISHTSYAATPLGRAFAESIPCMPVDFTLTERVAEIDEAEPSPNRQIVDELIHASRDSRNPERFERSIYRAMELLGFNARLLGGPGRTDVLVSVWVAPGQQRRVIVDAKTAASGQVMEGAISFDAIEEHRARHDAERVAVIGPSFPDGRLRGWARKRGVCLIDVPTLSQYLQLNEQAPLAPSVLAGIFDLEITNPRTLWDPSVRRHEVMRQLISTLWREANDDREIARSGGLLDVNAIRYLLRDKLDPDPEEIQEILEFLASPVIQSLKRKGEKYLPLESPETTAAKLRALGVGALVPHRPVGPFNELSVDEAAFLDDDEGEENSETQYSRPPRPPKGEDIDAAAVREWAYQKGLSVRGKGRLPSSIVKLYLSER